MNQHDELPIGSSSELELAHRQAVKYGHDLARVYVAEKARREELEVAYQALSAVFASTPDGLVVLDDAHTIQQANAAFGRLTEIAPEAAAGRPIDEVLVAKELRPALRKIASGEAEPGEIELTVTLPVKRSLLANVARLQAGRVGGWIIALRDQTKRKQLEQQKAEFINIASHELRTPLGAVLGYSELLKDSLTDIGDEPNELLTALIRGANRLRQIVAELMQFAEINQKDLDGNSASEFDLAELIDEVLGDAQRLAADKQVDLTRAGNEVISVHTDRSLLCTVIFQLIMNAINFNTPGGSVRVEARLADGQVVVQVVDSGIGIAKTDLETIFRAFFQVEHPDTRRVGGLGLGLSIAHRAITLLGGTLSVDSTLGKGTTFTLKIAAKG
jgi:PAS domain S-box-containing protein